MTLKIIWNGRHPARWEDPDAAKAAFGDLEPNRYNIQLDTVGPDEILVHHVYARYSMEHKRTGGVMVSYDQILTVAALRLDLKGVEFVFAGVVARAAVDAFSGPDPYPEDEIYYVFRPKVI